MKKIIGLIFGGKSVEHEVSVVTAIQAYHNINKNLYFVLPIYIDKQGQWYTGEILLNIENYKNIENLLKKADKIYLSSNSDEFKIFYKEKKIKSPLNFNKNKKFIKIDVFLPTTHGTNGEDGALQGIFEIANIPFVGSNVFGSACSMDKIFMKHIFKSIGLAVIDFIWFHINEWIENCDKIIENIKNKIEFPCIVKPAIAGSSIGIKKVENIDNLEEAVKLASAFCPKVIVEKYIIDMTEINCAVLGTAFKQKSSVCERPLTSNEILDYNSKYIRENSKTGSKSITQQNTKLTNQEGGMQSMDRIIPADIPDELSLKIQNISKMAFRELYCSGVARIDFIIDNKAEKLYINELNAIPGSLSFYLWEKTGINYTKLIDELIEIAFENYRIKQQTLYSYDSNLLNIQRAGQKNNR